MRFGTTGVQLDSQSTNSHLSKLSEMHNLGLHDGTLYKFIDNFILIGAYLKRAKIAKKLRTK